MASADSNTGSLKSSISTTFSGRLVTPSCLHAVKSEVLSNNESDGPDSRSKCTATANNGITKPRRKTMRNLSTKMSRVSLRHTAGKIKSVSVRRKPASKQNGRLSDQSTVTQSLVNYVFSQERRHHQEERDDDKAFFTSVLPTIKELTPLKKLDFRMEVLSLLKRIHCGGPSSVDSIPGRRLSTLAHHEQSATNSNGENTARSGQKSVVPENRTASDDTNRGAVMAEPSNCEAGSEQNSQRGNGEKGGTTGNTNEKMLNSNRLSKAHTKISKESVTDVNHTDYNRPRKQMSERYPKRQRRAYTEADGTRMQLRRRTAISYAE